MSTLKTHNLQSPDAGSVNIAMAPNAGMVVTGISTFSNKIGVGNVSPNRTLTVTSNGGQIDLHDTDNSTLGIYMNAGNASLYCRGNSTLGNGSMGGVFTVHTHPAGGSIQERLRITSGGDMGLGTNSPASSHDRVLTIAGTNSAELKLTGSNYGVTDTDGADVLFSYGGLYLINNESTGNIHFHTGSGVPERLRIESNGGIGIATDKIPRNYFLHIAAPSQDYTNTSTQLTDGGGIMFQHTDTLASTGRTYPGIFWSGNTSALGRARAGIIGVTASNNDATHIAFLTRTAADGTSFYPSDERMRISAAGDVGIGYDSPPCKLAIRDTTEFTAYGGVTPNSGNILLQLWNNPPNETANDHASMQFAVNGGSHNRVNTISAVAESAGNRKMAFTFCTDDAGSRTEKMRISGDGYVTKPETPSWVMRPSYSSNQTLGNSSVHAIGWTAADNNTHAKGVRLKNVTLSGSGFSNNLHNGQNVGKITVPVAGIYYVWCTIRMENQNNAGNIYLYVDGSQIVRQHVEDWNDDRYIHGRIQHIVTCNANSYIIWGVGCNGGVISGVNDTVNWCGGYLIG